VRFCQNTPASGGFARIKSTEYGISIMQSDRPADQTRRDVAAAHLMGEEAKKVKSAKVIRIKT
jgi:hypothetical protein